jgi:hypothetical protein
MKVKQIPCNMFICDVPKHKEHKKKLLNLIKEMPDNTYGPISKTDWNIEANFKRKYLDYFYSNVIRPVMNKQQKYLKARDWRIPNGWFQQYNKKSYHNWHVHEGANYTNVYFLELDSSDQATKIKTGRNKIIEHKAEEGQVVTFPGCLLHKSEEVLKKRKTIISFNSWFTY